MKISKGRLLKSGWSVVFGLGGTGYQPVTAGNLPAAAGRGAAGW